MTLTKAHFAFQTLALLLMGVGGVAAFLTKEAYGKPHLSSRHSWVAAAAGTLSLLNALGVRSHSWFYLFIVVGSGG